MSGLNGTCFGQAITNSDGVATLNAAFDSRGRAGEYKIVAVTECSTCSLYLLPYPFELLSRLSVALSASSYSPSLLSAPLSAVS